jgi:Putative Actinobacterial Holin-X, holin superfamily III
MSTPDPKAITRAPEPAPSLDGDPSLGALFGQLAQDSSTLIRQEIALAKAEVRESVRQTTSGAVKIGIAAALAVVGGLVLTAFLVLLLGDLIGNYWLAALIVGAVFALIGGLLARSGIKRLSSVQGAPERTLATLKEDQAWARSELQQVKRDLRS